VSVPRADRRRNGFHPALFAYTSSVLAGVAVDLVTGQRGTAALVAALLLHAGFFTFLLFRRPAALALLFLAMPLEPMLRTWAGTRFLTFVYGALLLVLFDLRAAWSRIRPLDLGFWLLFLVVVWMFLSLTWTPTRWDGLLYNFGMIGILVAYCMPRGLFRDRQDLDHALRALVVGAVASFLLHVAVLSDAREGRLGAHRAMSGQDVGANFAVALMAALYLARNRRRGRLLLLCAAGLLALGIALSVGRSAAAGMVAGTLAFLVLSSSGLTRWFRVAALLAAVGGSYAAAYVHNRPAFEPRVERTLHPESADRFFTGRVSIWTVALAMMHDHPFVGVGTGSFPDEFDRYYRLSPATHGFGRNPDAHSMPLRNAAEVGVPAALLYIAFLAYCLHRAWKARREPTGVGALAVGLTICCLVMTSVGALYQPVVWMGTGLGIWTLRFVPIPAGTGRAAWTLRRPSAAPAR
jgi:O-antigen ligase